MSETIENICPVLYLGKIDKGRLSGGCSHYLPEELNLFFGRLFPFPKIHLFLTLDGLLYSRQSEELQSLREWERLLGPKGIGWVSAYFDESFNITCQLQKYFGIKF